MRVISFIKYTLVTGLSLLAASCYRETDLDHYRDDNGSNLLTVNSLVTPDSTIQLMATRTYFFSDEHNERTYVRNLDVDVTINSETAGRMTYDASRNLYVSDVKVASGNRVAIHTRYSGNEVEAHDTVPSPVGIENLTVTRHGPVSIYTNNDYIFTYNLTFTDPAGEEDYYFLQWDAADRAQDLTMGERNFTHEYVFQQLANQIHSTLPGWEPYSPYGLPFSDKGIEGKQHTLELQEIVQMPKGSPLWSCTRMKRRFKLYTLSKPYYNYLVSILINQTNNKGLEGGMIDLGLADPTKVYSNINGGVGILGCYTTATTEIDPFEIVGPFPQTIN